MTKPSLIEIDFRSEPGAQLLAAIAARHGDKLAAFARVPNRLFALGSPWAPGLRFVGAEARLQATAEVLATDKVFSFGGTGIMIEDALTSCLGEGVERLSQVERAGDISGHHPVAKIQAPRLAGVGELIAGLALFADRQITADWMAAADLATGREVLVPADWLIWRPIDGPLLLPDTALSTGVAAGPTPEAAAVRALLELVERDAVALWWIGGRRGRPLADSHTLLNKLRQGANNRVSWLLDLTTDLAIPAIAAISVSRDGDQMACGMAARLSVAEAARAAILEMCQMELAIQLTELKRAERGDAGLNAVDCRHLERATKLNAETCELLHPRGAPRTLGPVLPAGDTEQFVTLQAAFARAGIDAGLVELTRPEYDIPVIAVLAPRLQRFPSAVHTDRLTAAIASSGGGAQWTHGVPIL